MAELKDREQQKTEGKLQFPSMVGQLVKNPPAVQETPVRFLGWEDPLEKATALHSSILASKIPRTEEPGRPHSM